MNKTIVFILLFVISIFAQKKLNPVRHDAIKEAWLAKDVNLTFDLLLKSYQSNPGNFITAYNLGYISYLNKKSSQALNYFKEAKSINPKFPYSYLMIAKIFEQSNNLKSAENEIRLGLKQKSDDFSLQLELARLKNKSGDFTSAIQMYKDLIEDFEDEQEPVAELASIYRKQKKFKQALQLLTFGEDEYPESGIVLEKYKLFRESKKDQEAKSCLMDLLVTYPNSGKYQKYLDTLKINYGVNEAPPPETFVKYKYILDPKEKLNYVVEYGFITLGWMKVRLEDELEINGKKVYHIVFYIDSNPSFDFLISLHPIYESYIDAETLSAVRSRLYTPDGEENLVRMYYFDYPKNEFRSYAVKNDGRFSLVTKDLPNAAQDGTSMLYLARGLVSNKISGKTVVVIHEKYKYAVIDFLNQTEEVEVKNKDVKALKIFAQAKFSGVAGMTGDAYGWFSTDNQAVPLEGHIDIILGSIEVLVDDESE